MESNAVDSPEEGSDSGDGEEGYGFGNFSLTGPGDQSAGRGRRRGTMSHEKIQWQLTSPPSSPSSSFPPTFHPVSIPPTSSSYFFHLCVSILTPFISVSRPLRPYGLTSGLVQ